MLERQPVSPGWLADRRLLLLFVFVFAFVPVLAACEALTERGPARPTPTIPLESCQISAPGAAGRLDAECATLAVPENRAANGGRQIELKIAVLPATSSSVAVDPYFFITGGPGQAATESFVAVASAFDEINETRDIVLIDQRGTGGSNALRCPVPEEEDPAALPAEEQITAWAEECVAGLDADLSQYTTEQAVADLDAVRAALGYEQINLYGVSYGSRVAFSYLRRYPERVRTVTVDGVVAPQTVLGPSVAADAQRALDLTFARCAADEACREAFPDLEASFAALLARLREGPAELNLVHPVSGERTDLTYTPELFASSVRLLNYAAETTALLPLLVDGAQESGDLSRLAAQSLLVTEDLAQSIAQGMNYSVLCAEDYPFFDPAEAERLNEGTYLGAIQTDTISTVCGVWPRAEVPADIHAPVQADVPVLLLSGEADPVTPPSNAELAKETLPNSLHIVLPGQGHSVIFRGCLPRVAANFVEAGTLDGLDTACAETIEPLPFFVNFAGPTP